MWPPYRTILVSSLVLSWLVARGLDVAGADVSWIAYSTSLQRRTEREAAASG